MLFLSCSVHKTLEILVVKIQIIDLRNRHSLNADREKDPEKNCYARRKVRITACSTWMRGDSIPYLYKQIFICAPVICTIVV